MTDHDRTSPESPDSENSPDTHEVSASAEAQGLNITARTQWQLIRGRFFRHRAALFGMFLLVGVVLLSFTSVGIGPLPGWWDKSPLATGPLYNDGNPTLSLVPEFLGGAGLALGEHPFGQDNVGKDYFALTMRGTQVSLIIAFLVGIVATIVATLIGACAGYFRGWTETVLMRVTDVLIAIPLLAIAAAAAKIAGQAGILYLGLVLGLVTWTQTARLVRSAVLSLREKEFVEAARSVGTSSVRIIFKHILPNTVGVIIVSVTLAIAAAVLLESALSFLGMGVQPPDTSLGRLITDYRSAMGTRPWLFYWPGLFIILIALSVNFIGDGLRDAFDPRQNRVRD